MKTNDIILNFSSVLTLILGLFLGQTLSWFIAEVFQLETNSGEFSLLAYLLSFGIPILLYNFFIIKKQFNHSLHFDFSLQNFRIFFLIFPMMFGMILMADAVTQQIPTEGEFFGTLFKMYQSQIENISLDPIYLILLTVFCAPIIEEVIFRGIIQKGMINNGVKPINAILISAFVFGAIHIYPWQFVGGFMLSLVMGLVYYKTQSLLMPILLHAFNNGIATYSVINLDTEDLSKLLNLKYEYIFLVGFVILIIPTYFFIKTKSISNNN